MRTFLLCFLIALLLSFVAFAGQGLGHLGGGCCYITHPGHPHSDYTYGHNGNSILYGAGGPDRLWGRMGNDVLRGNAGNDILDGGDGYDYCVGGDGYDTLLRCEAGTTGRD